ncbi:hypothetical protein HPB47_016092, partial [Ixodes persulcatus]
AGLPEALPLPRVDDLEWDLPNGSSEGAALLIGEHVLRDPPIQVTGVVAVVDTKGLYLHHVRHYTPLFIKRLIHIVQIHFIGDDYDKLHAFIPPELLPREYGGIHESYDCDGLEKELRRSSRYFEEIDQSGYRTK